MTAAAQAVPEAGPPTATQLKYSVYGGFAYTSLNQVNLSRYGLMGGEVKVTRDFGKYFGLMVNGSYYNHPPATPPPIPATHRFTALLPALRFMPISMAGSMGCSLLNWAWSTPAART